jgi:hypothetical protein
MIMRTRTPPITEPAMIPAKGTCFSLSVGAAGGEVVSGVASVDEGGRAIMTVVPMGNEFDEFEEADPSRVTVTMTDSVIDETITTDEGRVLVFVVPGEGSRFSGGTGDFDGPGAIFWAWDGGCEFAWFGVI